MGIFDITELLFLNINLNLNTLIQICVFDFQGVGYQQESFLPVPKVEEIPYEYKTIISDTHGPPAPSDPSELDSIG